MPSNTNRPPRRGPMGGGRGMSVPGEKAKDFKGAVKRLLKELNKFKILMLLSIILAIFSAVLTILAPDKLSELTDEISSGLTVNTDNLQELVNITTENLNEERLKEIIPQILDINIDQNTLNYILSNENISQQDKLEFQEAITDMSNIAGILKIDNNAISFSNNYVDNIMLMNSRADELEKIRLYLEELRANINSKNNSLESIPSILPIDSRYAVISRPYQAGSVISKGVGFETIAGTLIRATAPGTVNDISYDKNTGFPLKRMYHPVIIRRRFQ